MKVAKEVLDKVKSSMACKNRLVYEMQSHSSTVERWINLNEDNGKLTTAKAVEVIAEETNTPIKKILVA